MADFLSVIDSVGETDSAEAKQDDEEISIDEKELEEQVNDLVEIRKKDMLRKNLMNIVRENLILKKKIKNLEAKLENSSSNNDSYNLLFRIDTDGDAEEIPTDVHDSQSSFILTDAQEDSAPPEEEIKPGGNSCFNCLGDHLIADCPKPRDPKEISKNRREFLNNKANMLSNAPRYHVDEPQRFGHISPGLPSSKLREALRLRDDQIPEYIYRMRALGYPPGWLMHAEIKASGISLYHDRGEKMVEAGDEDGEVLDEKDKVNYDIERLFEWPGFNAPIPSEFRDETKKYRAVSLSRTKMLKEMVDELRPKEQKGYVRGKMQDTSCVDLTSDLIVLDATTEDSDQEMDTETQEVEDTTRDVLIEKGVSGDQSPVPGDGPGSVACTPSRQSSCSSNSNSVCKTEPGTPICEIFSPFSRLPNQNSFNKNMSEHVAFENLPNYTGKWEEMRGLLKKIRKRDRDQEEKEGSEKEDQPEKESKLANENTAEVSST